MTLPPPTPMFSRIMSQIPATAREALTVLIATGALLGVVSAALSPTGVAQALLVATILTVCCFLPVKALIGQAKAWLTPGDVVMFTAFGVAALGTLAVILRALGLEPAAALPVLGAVGIGGLFRPSSRLLWRAPPSESGGRNLWDRIAATVLISLLIVPYLQLDLLMGSAPWPRAFLNVDNPYHLAQVYSLSLNNAWPPDNLFVAGESLSYQYALQQSAALFVRTAGIGGHVAYFLVLGLLGAVALWIALTRIALTPQTRVPASALALLLFVCLWPHFWIATPIQLQHDLAIYGLFMVAIAALAAIGGQRGLPWHLMPILVLVTAAMRVHFGLALGVGYGLATLWDATRKRSVRPLLGPAVTMLAGAAMMFVLNFGAGGSTLKPTLGTWLMTHVDSMNRFDLLPWPAPRLPGWLRRFFIPLAFALVFVAAWPRLKDIPWRLVLFLAAPLLLVNAVRFSDLAPGGGHFGAFFSTIDVMNIFAFAILVVVVAASGRETLGSRAWAAIIVGALLAAEPIAVRTYDVMRIMADSSQGYEYTAAQDLGDALNKIPTHGTLIVTNQTSHPADNYARKDSNTLVAAMFGHRTYATRLRYSPDAPNRRQLNKRLTAKNWTPEIDRAAQRYGWTHLLINKRFPHPHNTPLRRVDENKTYVVYVFPGYAEGNKPCQGKSCVAAPTN